MEMARHPHRVANDARILVPELLYDGRQQPGGARPPGSPPSPTVGVGQKLVFLNALSQFVEDCETLSEEGLPYSVGSTPRALRSRRCAPIAFPPETPPIGSD